MSIVCRARGLILAVGLLACASTAQAAILFQNAPHYPGTYNSFTSQIDPVNGYLEFSHFELGQASGVTSIDWQGLYVSANLVDNPPPAAADSFQILVYGDSGGLPNPGNVLYANTFAVGAGADNVVETFNSNDPNFFLGFQTQTTAAIYDYSLALSAPISLAGGTTYWLSVAAVTPTPVGLPYWGWNSGGPTGGPADITYFTADNATFVPLDRNRTFTLSGAAAVPEPSTLLTASLGALALLGIARSRRAS